MTDDQAYPRIVEVQFASGRPPLTFRVNGPPQPEVLLHFEAEVSPELLHVDQDVDTERPRAFPPLAVSLSAWRFFATLIPSDHPLEHDWHLVRWWWMQRETGALDDLN